MFMTAVLFPGSIFLVAFVLNFVAMAYQSLTAISFGSIVCHPSNRCIPAVRRSRRAVLMSAVIRFVV